MGLLLQDPSAALVSERVGRDVAFGLENVGVPREHMPPMVDQALAAAQFPYGSQRRTGSLSGGETQRLALAGALALGPDVLLLDEPTSMLDPVQAEEVRRSVLSVCGERGTTLVVVEHQIEPWVEAVDRCVVLDAHGRVIADGPPAAVLREHAVSLAAQGIWVPGHRAPEPLSVDPSLVSPLVPTSSAPELVTGRGLTVRYRGAFGRRAAKSQENGPDAIADVDCDLVGGRATVLAGRSGAGKSTLLSALAGLQPADNGSARIDSRFAGRRGREMASLTSKELARAIAWIPQLPAHALVRNTVLDELLVTARVLGHETSEAEERAEGLLAVFSLAHLAGASVHHLSGGEQRRLVVAAALTHGPAGLLLDEPTVGQDRLTWAAVTGACLSAMTAGVALAVATHDARATQVLTEQNRGSALRLSAGRVAGSE